MVDCLLDAESLFLLVSVVDVIIYAFIQACFYNHYKLLSSSSLKESKCTRSLYCVINPLHLNGRTLSQYLSAPNGRLGKHCPAMSCHFKNFVRLLITCLFFTILV